MGHSASLDYGGIAERSPRQFPLGEPMLILGFFLFLVGLFFKLSLIPFQSWAPDVYQGAPTPVTAFMAVGGKTAAAAGAIRIFLSVFTVNAGLGQKWMTLFMAIGLLTIFVGSMIALTQRHQAPSGILVHRPRGLHRPGPRRAGRPQDSSAHARGVALYLAAYLFMNMGAFRRGRRRGAPRELRRTMRSYSGLGTSSPYLAALFTLFMLSLAGIPLTAGFLGKFYVFGALVNGGYYGYAALGLLGAVIATYYYLKVVVTLYFPSPGEDPRRATLIGTGHARRPHPHGHRHPVPGDLPIPPHGPGQGPRDRVGMAGPTRRLGARNSS